MKAIAFAAMVAVSAGSAGAATVIPAYFMVHRYDIWGVAVRERDMLPGNKTANIDYCYSYGCGTDTYPLHFYWTNSDIHTGLPTRPFFLADIPTSYSNAISTSLVVTTDYIPEVPVPASGFLIAVAAACLSLFRRRSTRAAVVSDV